jgi:hypothetical protein
MIDAQTAQIKCHFTSPGYATNQELAKPESHRTIAKSEIQLRRTVCWLVFVLRRLGFRRLTWFLREGAESQLANLQFAFGGTYFIEPDVSAVVKLNFKNYAGLTSYCRFVTTNPTCCHGPNKIRFLRRPRPMNLAPPIQIAGRVLLSVSSVGLAASRRGQRRGRMLVGRVKA